MLFMSLHASAQYGNSWSSCKPKKVFCLAVSIYTSRPNHLTVATSVSGGRHSIYLMLAILNMRSSHARQVTGILQIFNLRPRQIVLIWRPQKQPYLVSGGCYLIQRKWQPPANFSSFFQVAHIFAVSGLICCNKHLKISIIYRGMGSITITLIIRKQN